MCFMRPDWLFGTYQCPSEEPLELGVSEPMPRNYLGQLWHPFVRGIGRRQPPRVAEDSQRSEQGGSRPTGYLGEP
jgi:hypothetical protein